MSVAAQMSREQAAGRNRNNRFYGKYRGTVEDNIDPLMLGRIIPNVPAMSGMLLNWALPCTPYAGQGVGFYAIPPIGAHVWIEFEAGDPEYPIWSGCFWAPDQTPLGEGPPEPFAKVFRTESMCITMSDVPEVGGMFITVNPPAVATPLSMVFTSEGITINAAPAIISMITEEGITITYPPCTTSMTDVEFTHDIADTIITMTEEGMEMESPLISMTADADVSIEAGAAFEVTAGADIAITAGAACEVTGGGDVAITAGAACEMTAGLDCAVTAGGACEMTAGLDCAVTAGGACEVTGALTVAITGVTVELIGIGTIDGGPIL